MALPARGKSASLPQPATILTPKDIRSLSRLFPGLWNRWYIPSKFRTDPLYRAVFDQYHDSELPLLDIGCGLGLLAFYLRYRGLAFPIHGVDYDIRKIHAARKAADASGFPDLDFHPCDARRELPDHHGNVTILDILQFFQPDERQMMLRQAADRLAPGAKLVIRSGLRDTTWRFHITVAGDIFAKAARWMKSAPSCYPNADDFIRALSGYGEVSITPLWGNTPFNNHLIVLTRR